MENFAQIYAKLDIFGIFLFKKGLNPISLVAALMVQYLRSMKES